MKMTLTLKDNMKIFEFLLKKSQDSNIRYLHDDYLSLLEMRFKNLKVKKHLEGDNKIEEILSLIFLIFFEIISIISNQNYLNF